jgi:hypothetical protein
MIDFMKSVSDWITNNMATFTALLSSLLIGVPTIVNVARIMTNAKENKNYRGITLIRLLTLIGFLVGVLAEWLIESNEDLEFARKLKNAKRICDLNEIGAERENALVNRVKRLEALKANSDKTQTEFGVVPVKKGRK